MDKLPLRAVRPFSFHRENSISEYSVFESAEIYATLVIQDKDKAVFLYYVDHRSVGQIKLCANWNGYALIEDFSVSGNWRNKGIGTKLLEKAVQWAKQNNLMGLMLETQDVNVAASRFYARNNFIIGGVDRMLYSNLPAAKNEIAIFWYYKF